MKTTLILTVTFGLVLAGGTSIRRIAHAEDWTRFRGPNGSGISDTKTVPDHWTDQDYNWKIDLPGIGHSSPVVWKDHIFVTAADKETGQRHVIAIKTSDGSMLWKKSYDSKTFRMNGDNSYASATPAVDAQRVYVTWTTPDDYTLLALDHNGNEVWKISLGPYISQHGSGASPVVFDDTVILVNDQEGPTSFIIAVDAATGKTRWKTSRKSSSCAASTPCIYQPKSGAPQLIVTSRTEGMASLDPRTGKLNWELADVFDKRVVASPIIADDLVIGNCGEGKAGTVLCAVRQDESNQKPQIAWKRSKSIPYVPTPLFTGKSLFFLNDSGSAVCVKPATGDTLYDERLGGNFYASPICVNGRIYCVSRKGEVIVLSADDKFQIISRINLGEGAHATPAVADGKIYFRTFSKLFSLGGKS